MPGPGHPLPVADVLRRVAVVERPAKDVLTDPPVDEQVLREKAARHHSEPVVQPARRGELPHRGIDDRIAGPARHPGVDVSASARASRSARASGPASSALS